MHQCFMVYSTSTLMWNNGYPLSTCVKAVDTQIAWGCYCLKALKYNLVLRIY